MFEIIINTIDEMEEELLYDVESINHTYIISYRDDCTIDFSIESTYHNDSMYELELVHKRDLIFSKIYNLKDYCNLILKILKLQLSYGESEYIHINKIKIEAIL